MRDVHVVGAPVGHLAAGVLEPPAELGVAALWDVLDQWGLAEPPFPIEVRRRLLLLERPAAIAAADCHDDLVDFSQPAFAAERDRAGKRAVAALLRADLE